MKVKPARYYNVNMIQALLISLLASQARLQWGTITVVWDSLDFDSWDWDSETPQVIFREGKKTLHKVDVFMARIDTVDLNSDRVPELIIEDYSGGAHCCFRYLVYTRVPRFELLGNFLMGNGQLSFEDLDDDGVMEAVGYYDGLAYFDYSYAASPGLPIVFKLKHGKFIECTRDFPQLVEQDLADYLGDYDEETPQTEDDQYFFNELRRARAAKILAQYMILGDEKSGWETVRRLDPEMLSWLRERAHDIRAIIKRMSTMVIYNDKTE